MHEVCFAVVSDWRASLHNIRSSVVAVGSFSGVVSVAFGWMRGS